MAILVVAGAALMPMTGTAADGDVLAQLDRAQSELYARVAPAVVYVITKDGFGSGVILRHDGLVLTNEHVVRNVETVDIVSFAGVRYTGKVVEHGRGTDLAVVQVTAAENLPFLEIGDGPGLVVGQWVAAVGHAQGGGWSFTTGTVSNVYTATDGQTVLQTQVPLNHGNSGGPLVDRQGRVVGIATASLEKAQNLNFAIRIDVATLGLAALEPVCNCLVVTAPAGMPIFFDGSVVGTGPRVALLPPPGSHQAFAVVGGRKVERTVVWPGVRRISLE